ncbi:MAG: carboxylesterase family protein [Alphaproteobacteria bacterium]|jgi:para-nitrobenzyl esterase|nr:carboxylesterase family protein [Alphaproteobacteria bacterium]MDP6831309.1 carboxylesterase family protein [Alphaproteobacteria bacterium]
MSNASEVQEAGPVTSIESGQIEGLSENGVDAYKNIPFGADTGGANRFRPP